MKYNYEDILSILALFDKEDIPYIKSSKLNKYNATHNKVNNSKVKVKKIGGLNDRTRK